MDRQAAFHTIAGMKPETYTLHDRIEREHWWFCGRRAILQEIARSVCPPAAGKRLLDIGCGTGANLAAWATEYAVTGIDISEDAVRMARERYPALDIRRVTEAAEREALAAKSDLVLLCDVLEHVEDEKALLAGIIHAMRPGANCIVTVPADMRLWSPHDDAFGHLRRYDMASFRPLWADLPVRVRVCSFFNARLFPVIYAIRRLTRVLGMSVGNDGTDLAIPAPWMNRYLTAVFSGESRRLLRVLRNEATGYCRGVSLMAVLERS